MALYVSANSGFILACEALIADVATFANGDYQPTVVFDASGNLYGEHKIFMRFRMCVALNPYQTSADTVIKKLFIEHKDVLS
ncbi:MAG: hypothetical protein HUJ51_06065 [Eggerthellaceae bacterium]|nr:hypothetical protein [Eggerthellaceae bacterium]